MNNFITLVFFFLIFSGTADQAQQTLVEYTGRPIQVKYFRNNDKEYRRDKDDVHVKLKITDPRLKSLTNEEIEQRIQIDFMDSLGNKVQPANLGFIHYSKPRDIESKNETGILKHKITLKNHKFLNIIIPIRGRIKHARSEGIVGYRFPVGPCDIRITVLAGENKQELRIPLIIR